MLLLMVSGSDADGGKYGAKRNSRRERDLENDFNEVSGESEESNLMKINLRVSMKIRASQRLRECRWECKANHYVAILTF